MVVALLLCASGVAAARDDEAAAQHFSAGEQYYLRGAYREAIREFQEAYRLSDRPELLFNIAQAYERAGDVRNARVYLRRYLDSGVAPAEEKPLLEEKLAAWDARIAEEDRKIRERPRPFKTWKWVATGLGVALVGASVGFTIDSALMSQRVEDAQGPGEPFPKDLEERGERDEVLAIVTGAAGGVALGIGILFFALDKPPRLEVTPVAGGGRGLMIGTSWQW
jgi:tetratricopeptide (TPR) repeat protein